MPDSILKPTIAIVAPYFPPEGGGLERYAKEVATRIKKDYNSRVVVITSTCKKQKDTVVEQDGLLIYRLAYDFKISNTPFSFSWFFKVRKILKTEKPQIINIHMPVAGIGDVASMVSGKIPVIVTYHSGSMRKNKSKLNCLVTAYEYLFLPLLLRKAKHIISSSDFVMNSFLRNYRNKCSVITPGVDLDFFKPNLKNINKNKLLFVAGLNKSEKYKGLTNLIESMVMIKMIIDDVHLTVVGDGDMRPEYENMVTKLGLEKSITFKGRLGCQHLLVEYQNANLLVQASSNESFSMVVLEAMACGLPVVATDVGNTRSIVESYNTGFLLTSNNTEKISVAVLELLNNEKKCQEFGNNSRKRIVDSYGWDEKVKNYFSIISNFLIIKKTKYLYDYDWNRIKKVAIIGVTASGKTMLSRELSKQINLPIFHVDQIIWRGNWERVPKQDYCSDHNSLLKNEKWIIEGFVEEEMSNRLEMADLVIYLDYSFLVSVYRYFKRLLIYKNTNREEFSSDSIEKFDLKTFLGIVFGLERSSIMEAVGSISSEKIIKINSPAKLEYFMGSRRHLPHKELAIFEMRKV